MRLPPRPIAVAIGAILGSWARWGLASEFPVAVGTFPVTTFAINVVGAALLGVVLVALLDGRIPRTSLHALIGTGVIGTFTTFSTWMVESVELGRTGHVAMAVIYVGTSLVVGLAALMVTMAVARRVMGRGAAT